ncbi:hypothetical protein HHI36_023613 [Cryptolaemus montrouzieri]|uniref:Uncharacterized protein n=1 Tax=Cryptolaemus montrouzieri TaxID=559131 RepID=A0ABD2PGZ1_9CUCU
MPLTDADGVNDRSAKTRGGGNNAILCNYCNRKVIDFVEYFQCKEFFHHSCLIKEASMKSSTCQHEVKSANSRNQGNTSPMDSEVENKFLEMQVEYLQALLSQVQSKNLILIENNELLRVNVANLVRTRIGSSSISVSGSEKLESSDHGTTSRTAENDLQQSPSASYANITATKPPLWPGGKVTRFPVSTHAAAGSIPAKLWVLYASLNLTESPIEGINFLDQITCNSCRGSYHCTV